MEVWTGKLPTEYAGYHPMAAYNRNGWKYHGNFIHGWKYASQADADSLASQILTRLSTGPTTLSKTLNAQMTTMNHRRVFGRRSFQASVKACQLISCNCCVYRASSHEYLPSLFAYARTTSMSISNGQRRECEYCTIQSRRTVSMTRMELALIQMSSASPS